MKLLTSAELDTMEHECRTWPDRISVADTQRLIAQARKALDKPAWPSRESFRMIIDSEWNVDSDEMDTYLDVYDLLIKHVAPAKEKE